MTVALIIALALFAIVFALFAIVFALFAIVFALFAIVFALYAYQAAGLVGLIVSLALTLWLTIMVLEVIDVRCESVIRLTT